MLEIEIYAFELTKRFYGTEMVKLDPSRRVGCLTSVKTKKDWTNLYSLTLWTIYPVYRGIEGIKD